jgi:NADH:ubiquinone oxidoreductase subunit E
MLVNDKVYTQVKPEDVADILTECRQVLSPNRPMPQEH